MAALPNATPFAAVPTAIACIADVLLNVRATFLKTADRGTLRAALGSCDGRPPGGRPGGPSRVQKPRGHVGAARVGMGGHPARSRGRGTPPATPRPALALEGSARIPGAATLALTTIMAAPQPVSSPPPHYPPGHPPYLASLRIPWPTVPAPATLPPSPAPALILQPPLASGVLNPGPQPQGTDGIRGLLQLIMEVFGLNLQTMTAAVVNDVLRAHLGATQFVLQHTLQRGYDCVPCFEAVWPVFA